ADLVGGSLGPSLLGGRLPLARALSTTGSEALASTLHLSRDEAILGVQRVVEASMAKAMRLVLARRGLDPRDFALLAFGGAGPMHAWALAQQLGVRTVLVPFLPGAFSAYGILNSPIRAEYGRSVLRPLERAETVIESAIEEVRDRAISVLRTEGHDVGRAQFEPSVDLRFKGRDSETTFPLPGSCGRPSHAPTRLRTRQALRRE